MQTTHIALPLSHAISVLLIHMIQARRMHAFTYIHIGEIECTLQSLRQLSEVYKTAACLGMVQ